MRGTLIIATVVALFLAAGATTVQAHLLRAKETKTLREQMQHYKSNAHHALAFLRRWNDIRHWQMVGRHHADAVIPEPSVVLYHRRLLHNSIRGMERIRRILYLQYLRMLARAIPHKAQWLCIHHYEGSWSDSGDPYWGGLQMDRTFMQHYGSDMIRKYGGWAHLWSPTDQMIVAERAAFMRWHGYAPRGFTPWPNTARMCGLI